MMFLAFGQMVHATGWTQKASLPAIPRTYGVAFSIGAYGYLGTGLDTASYQGYHCQGDFWQYDTTADAWTQKADFGGTPRYGAVGFSIGSKGYIATGYDLGNFNNDLWEYDPTSNTWTQKSDMPVGGRYQATCFSIGTKGYIGTGGNDTASLTDLWQYDQLTDTWTQMADFGGGARSLASGLSINGKGYIGLGGLSDFWEYDPTLNTWTQKTNFTGDARNAAAAFTIGGIGYVGTGNSYNTGNDETDFYGYDPTADAWTTEISFIGLARDGAVGFSIGPNGYIGTGEQAGNQQFGLTDVFEFNPPCNNPVITGASASSTTICGNTPTNLTAAGSLNSALNWYWYTGSCSGTFVNTGTTISVSPSVTTTYYVLGQGGCAVPSGCDSVTITVNPPPAPVITPSGATNFCQGGSVSLDAGSFSSYSWSTSSTNESITVSSSGTYSVTVSDGIGCTGTTSQLVTANANPSPTIAGGSVVCFNSSLVLDAGNYTSYIWSTSSTTETTTVNSANTFTVTVTDSNGCTGIASTTVTMNPQISPVITGGNSFCAGDSLTITTGTYSSYHWNTTSTNQSITVHSGNTYRVTVTDAQGCTGTASHLVIVNQDPAPSITPSGPTTFCSGDSVTLDAGSFASYFWSDGSTTQSIIVNTASTYTVTVLNNNGCSGTASQAITVHSSPSPTITPSGSTTFCQGNSVSLTASAFPQYSWSTSATVQSITVATSGNYIVTVTDNNGCTGTGSQTVTANPNPTPNITGGSSICSSSFLTLDAGHYTLYHWSNNSFTETITVISTGTYTVTVTDINGCTGTTSQAVTVGTSPNPSITGGSIFCSGSSLTLSTGTFTTYLWNTGATTESITVNTANGYTVTVSNASGCTASATDSVSVSVNPTPVITGGTIFCAGGSITLSVPFFTLYHWSNGSVSETATVTSANTYYVTVTNINGCTGTASTTVTTHPDPTPVITTSGQTTFCNGGSDTLTTGSFVAYHWNNGVTSQSIRVTTSGDYIVTVTDANGCTATVAENINVIQNPTPTVNPSGTIKLCDGQSLTLLSSNGIVYSWNNGSSTQDLIVNQTGTYIVTVYYGVNCSATSSPVNVNVFPIPVATISSAPTNPILCSGDSLMLTTNSSEPLTYLWNGGATTQSIWADTAGTFIVNVTDTNACHSTSSITVSAYTNPVASFTFSNFITTTSFTNTSANSTDYFWYFGDGNVSNHSNPTHIYSQVGTYTVKLIVTNPCGTDSVIHTIVVTGVNTLNAPSSGTFSTYPNPAQDQLTILFNSAKESVYSIELMDITGRIITQSAITSTIGDNQYMMNLTSIAKGVYMLSLKTGDSIQKAKIVIE